MQVCVSHICALWRASTPRRPLPPPAFQNHSHETTFAQNVRVIRVFSVYCCALKDNIRVSNLSRFKFHFVGSVKSKHLYPESLTVRGGGVLTVRVCRDCPGDQFVQVFICLLSRDGPSRL